MSRFFKRKNSIPLFLSLMTINFNMLRLITDVVHMKEIYNWNLWSAFMKSLSISPFFAIMEIGTLIMDAIFVAWWFIKFIEHDSKLDKFEQD